MLRKTYRHAGIPYAAGTKIVHNKNGPEGIRNNAAMDTIWENKVHLSSFLGRGPRRDGDSHAPSSTAAIFPRPLLVTDRDSSLQPVPMFTPLLFSSSSLSRNYPLGRAHAAHGVSIRACNLLPQPDHLSPLDGCPARINHRMTRGWMSHEGRTVNLPARISLPAVVASKGGWVSLGFAHLARVADLSCFSTRLPY